MRIILLRTNNCKLDPRVEKEVESMCKISGAKPKIVCWDRDEKYRMREAELTMVKHTVPIVRFGIPAIWGGGMKANFFPMLKFEWKMFWWLMFHHKEYDTIHACDLLTGLPAYLPCKLFRKKLVYDIYDYYAETQRGPKWILNIFRKLENGIVNGADATIICCEERQAQIAGTHPRKLVVLHNAPSSGQISQADEASDFVAQGDSSRMRIVYVGNLVEERLIMEALACANEMPEVEFHIGGYGVLENQVQQLAETHENIYFYGKMAYRDVLALEKQCHIMLAIHNPEIPNYKHSAPNKFYEALALGKPLVVFYDTTIDEIVQQYDIGAVCEKTEAGLQGAYEELLKKRQDWPQMGERMTTLFVSAYSWDIMERRLIALYQNL